jgi:hypothetical protein
VTALIRLFISSSPDLVAEREALGQAVAELPVSMGWEIEHTPGAGESAHDALAFIERCDLYLIVLGADFAAPMGLEWQRAQDALKPILAYRKRELHSPSAQSLLRHADIVWTAFESPAELKAEVTRGLAQVLPDRGEQLGLHLSDIDGLLTLVRTETEEEPSTEPDKRRGAGQSGVILGRGD